MNINLSKREAFVNRHNGPTSGEIHQMIQTLGVSSLEQLIKETVPANIRMQVPLQLPDPLSEFDYLNQLKELANQNIIAKNFIGQGYYGTIVPGVIQRNILENPGWYTAYTPYPGRNSTR